MRAERRTLLAFGAALAAVGVAVLVLAGGARGAGCDDTWTNTAGGVWGTPGNWSLDATPASNANVCITTAGNYNVTLTARSPSGL